MLIAACNIKEKEIYIATGGNDKGSGGMNDPFRTIQRAMDFVKELSQQDKYSSYKVWIRGGGRAAALTAGRTP